MDYKKYNENRMLDYIVEAFRTNEAVLAKNTPEGIASHLLYPHDNRYLLIELGARAHTAIEVENA